METDRTRGPGRIRIRAGRGARSCERLLLEDLDGLLDTGDPTAAPIVLLVPSESLRQHLLTRIVRRRGRGVAGVACYTLHRVAVEIVSRARPATPVAGADLFPVLARREARREPALRRSLDHLRDGYGAVLAAVRDLLDAGLEPAHAEGLDEALAAEGPAAAGRAELERARAVVRVAVRTLESMRELGLGRGSTLLREAAEVLRGDGEDRFAARAVLVHGFADATGVGTDLIEALLRRCGGGVYLDRPPDPGDPERADPGDRYSRHFTERLALLAEVEPPVRSAIVPSIESLPKPVSGSPAGVEEESKAGARPAPAPAHGFEAAPGRVEMFRALGAEAELREVSRRIRELLDGGAEPESIGLVARSFDAYRSSLAAQLRRRGIPFSGSAPAVAPGAVARRLRALVDLLRLRQRTPTERWLEASGERAHRVAVYDLRLALFSLGAGRLDEVAALSLEGLLEGDAYPLPVRRGYWRPDEDGDEEDEDSAAASTRLSRRRVPGAALRRALEAASRLTRRLESWNTGGPLDGHLERLRALLLEELGWGRDEPLALEVFERVEGSLAGTSRRLVLDLDEFLMLLEQALEGLGAEGPGGLGGGVQVLDVTEARGRTFEHLFVVGLNRGVFPRAVREDPLLSDALRAVLARHGAGVLPDLPMKLAGYDEERYLFAQLLSAAPRVTLSWQQVDDDNQSVAPSPLVERLRFSPVTADAASGDGPPVVPPFPAPLAGRPFAAGDRPARDNAVLLALDGRRDALPAVFATALRRARAGGEPGAGQPPELSAAQLDELGRVRTAVLEEVDPRRGEPEGEARRRRLGPFFGLVGPSGARDPRGGPLFVTTLERLAGCPWQAFLEKLLRLEPPPDPLASLPALDPLLVGELVHRVLESVVRGGLGGDGDPVQGLEELAGRAGVAVAWPDGEALEALATEEARRLVRLRGIGLGGFAEVLARAVLPYLAVARRLDWGRTGPPEAVGVETFGAVEIERPRGSRSVHFKADRVDRHAGRLALTDYKTGRRAPSVAVTPAARRRGLVAKVAAGRWLQAPVYSLAGGAGRFLFLSPLFEGPEEARRVEVEARDAELERAFLQAAGAALGAWEEGVFFPRLEEARQAREPRRCAYCDVKEACLRGDSGARARLRDWMQARETGETAVEPGVGPAGEPASDAERAAVELWFLGASGGRRSAGR